MKKMKKLLAVVMIMVLAMSLCGCGNTAKKLYGSWEMTVDFSEEVESQLGDEMGDFHHDLSIKLIMEFNEDGTLRMYADEEYTTESVNAWIDAVVDYTMEETYAQAEENGMSREEFDEVFAQQYGMTMEEMMYEQIESSFSVEDLIADINEEATWEAKGDKLYIDGNYDLFTVEGDTLTISLPEGAEVDESELIDGLEYPFVLTRVAE